MSKAIEKLRALGLFELKKVVKPGVCAVKFCTRDSKSPSHVLCHRHHQIRFRACRKTANAFSLLQMHAEQRGLEFNLSKDYFAGLTDAFCMHDHRAESRKEVMTIDRKDATKGYIRGNLVVITMSENAWKSNVEKRLPEHVLAVLARKRAQVKEKLNRINRAMYGDPENPF